MARTHVGTKLSDETIRAELLRQLAGRGPTKSICPSEVARALAPDWRSLMTRVREVAVLLAQEQRIEILRKGRPVEPGSVRGVIRLRLKGLD